MTHVWLEEEKEEEKKEEEKEEQGEVGVVEEESFSENIWQHGRRKMIQQP